MRVLSQKAKCDQSDPGGHMSEIPTPYTHTLKYHLLRTKQSVLVFPGPVAGSEKKPGLDWTGPIGNRTTSCGCPSSNFSNWLRLHYISSEKPLETGCNQLVTTSLSKYI